MQIKKEITDVNTSSENYEGIKYNKETNNKNYKATNADAQSAEPVTSSHNSGSILYYSL